MKEIYFEMLDFKAKIPDNCNYCDLGYTDDLMELTKRIFENLGYKVDEKSLERKGVDLKNNRGGMCISRGGQAIIFYTLKYSEAEDIHCRAHEEAHVACSSGLRKTLEKMIDTLGIESLAEEDFCNKAGLYALRKKGIKIQENLLRTYEGRLFK